MSKQVQRRRGTTAEHATFTGVAGEITVDTTKKTVVVHDGATAGGTPLARESHNHDGSYATVAHTHAGVYAPVAHAHVSNDITLSNTGVGVTEVTTVTDIIDHFLTGTLLTGGGVTDNADGTFSIAACEVLIRDAASDHSTLRSYAVASAGPFTPADNDVSYYYVDYNGGAPQWAVGTAPTDYNGQNKMQAWTVARRGTRLQFIDSRGQSLDGNRKTRRLLLETSGANQGGYWHTRGGSVLAGSGLNLTLTSGKFFYGLAPLSHAAFDTSVAGTGNFNAFDYYRNRAGWTYTADSKLIDATQYDNAGTLTTMVAGRWRTDWAYLVLCGANPRMVVIIGDAQYTSLALAQASSHPATLPGWMDGSSVMLGQIVIQKGAASFSTQSAFNTAFSGSAVASHNDLGALQGGTTGEYYHLSLNDVTKLADAASSSHTHAGVYEPADATILKSAAIGATVQGYDANTAKLNVAQSWTERQTLKGVRETAYSLTGTDIDPANGSIQTKTLSANTTFTESLADGDSVLIGITAGSYTVTWPSLTWVKVGGSGTAPTLTSSGVNWVVLWQVGGVLRGAFLGTA